jgi:hypothetical protein
MTARRPKPIIWWIMVLAWFAMVTVFLPVSDGYDLRLAAGVIAVVMTAGALVAGVWFARLPGSYVVLLPLIFVALLAVLSVGRAWSDQISLTRHGALMPVDARAFSWIAVPVLGIGNLAVFLIGYGIALLHRQRRPADRRGKVGW